MSEVLKLQELIKACRLCEGKLPMSPNPVVRFSASSKLLIVGQAPGLKVHNSGIPWDDKSGERLRGWLNLIPEQFYDEKQIAIVPTAFCYPGRGKSGDLPPAPGCAPKWHQPILSLMPEIKLVLLIGQYAINYYLPELRKENLTDVVRNSLKSPQGIYFPLPHPSPRNNIWLRKHPWFEQEIVPELRQRVQEVLKN